MQIKPGSIVKYRHHYTAPYVIVEIRGNMVYAYEIRTGEVLTMTVAYIRVNFLFL